MRLLIFMLTITMFSFWGCENSDVIAENEQLKKQVSELKTMTSRMRESDDKFIFLASRLSGIKGRIKTNMGDIEVKFFPEKAPLQCFNFITRAESGFYDNTQFHRIMKDFMIQGGDPFTKTNNKSSYGQGGPIVNIPHEFNNINHKRGILSTARQTDVNAGAGSQFFIMHADKSHLNGQYTAFGEVTKGMDIVDKIANLKVNKSNYPEKPVRISTIEVFR